MRYNHRFAILTLALTALVVGPVSAEPEAFHYRLKVRVDPDASSLKGEAWIQSPPAPRFFLHPGLAIRTLTADGNDAVFHRESSEILEYTVGTAVVLGEPSTRELHVVWSGAIEGMVAGVNTISPKLVELAYYAAWFPIFEGQGEYTFDLEVDLPEGFVATTNGRRTRAETANGRSKTAWTSWSPTWDMVVVASPQFATLEGGSGDGAFEAYYDDLPEPWVRKRMEGLVECRLWLADLYGRSPARAPVRFVFPPRDGWDYYREPVSVMSQGRTRSGLDDPYQEAGGFRGGCHEIAHFWWSIADAASPEDWINEGLAEFSAYRFTAERYGPEWAERRLEEYRRSVAQTKTSEAIAETETSSPDREVNRYYKTTLMLLEARRRFGEQALDQFLRELYTRFVGTRDATTSGLLLLTESHLGREARDFFRAELFRKPTVDSDAREIPTE